MNFSLKTSLQCIELTQLLSAINHTTEVLQITGSLNMGTVNHTTEVLQRRLLVLQIWAWSTMPRKITDSSNMGTVNHAMENLQHRILDFSSLNIAH